MATEKIGRAVLELATDAGTFFTDIDKAEQRVKGLGKTTTGVGKDVAALGPSFGRLSKDLQGFSGQVGGVVSGFKSLGVAGGPLGGILETLQGGAEGAAAGLSTLGPVGAVVAVSLAAVTAGAAAVVAGVAAAGAVIVTSVQHAADLGDELFTLSNKTGISVEALSKFKFIAAQTDAPVETIIKSVSKLGQNLAENSTKSVSAIKAIGLSVDEVRKQSPDQAFITVVTALGKIPDAGKRAAAGAAIFGKSFRKIAQLTEEDLQGLGKQAEDLGLVFSSELAVAGDRFNDALGGIGASLSALSAHIGSVFLPVAIALVETFRDQLVSALGLATQGSGHFAEIIAQVAVIAGQSLAGIVIAGADVVRFLTEFFAGSFIGSFALLDFFGQAVSALGEFLRIASYIQPGLAPAVAAADAAGAKLRAFALSGVQATGQVSGQILKYADAVKTAAAITGATLPAAVEKVKGEIEKQAEAMRKAQADAKGFGEALEADAESAKKAAHEADEFNKSQDALLKRMQAAGVMTQEVTATALAPLIEALNEAARVSDTQLAATLKDQAPLWDKIAAAVQRAGGDVTMVTSIYEAFVEKAGLPTAASLVGMESAIRQLSVGELVSNMGQLNGVGREVAAQQEIVNQAFEAFGIKSPQALQKVAEAARSNYAIVSTTAGATKAQVKDAWDQMVAAQLAAQGKVPSAWKTEILPSIVGTVKQIGSAIEGSFSQMLLGAKGFKDGFLDIWSSIKAGIGRILTEILGDFTSRFLKGILAALTGAKGGFAGAFAGLFGGGGGGGGGILGGLLGGLLGGGGGAGVGLAGTIPAGGGIGIAGLMGGGGGAAAAGGGGLFGLGALGTTGLIGGAVLGGYGLYKWLTRGQRANMKANDSRDEFTSQFGGAGTGAGSGFANLAAKLTEATGEAGGGSLFKAFLDAHKAEDVAKAIENINKALADYEAKTKSAADAEAAQATQIDATKTALEEKTKAIREQMSGLDDELKKLNASEAPEEHMGTVERQTRERIAREKDDLQRQLDEAQKAAADAIEAIKTAGTGANTELQTGGQTTIDGLKDGWVTFGQVGKDQIDALRLLLAGMGKNIPPINIPVHVQMPEGPDGTPVPMPGRPPIPMADGGFGRVTRPTLFLAGEAGPEDVAFSGANRRLPTGTEKPRVSVIPAVFYGRPSVSDVEDFVDTMARAESLIAGNRGEVRTRLLSSLGLA